MPLEEFSIVDGRYRLERRLGQGGMGVVYEARHLGTGRRLAIKVIPADPNDKTGAVARFQREARAAGQIESRHVARVVDTGRDEATGDSYLAMDLLEGEDVEGLVGRLGPLPPDLAVRIASQACAGLVKAHEAGVVHRDIKPSNLFLARQDGGEIIVTLLDFGIAKMGVDQLATVGESVLTRTGSLVGSPLYMSPEQARGAKTIDHRTDIWSLGVVLYEALAGSPPNSTTESLGSLILAICSRPPPPVQERAPWVGDDLAEVLRRALAVDPKARFATAAEMASTLRALLPSGHAIHESCLQPLDPNRRALVADRLVVRPPGTQDAEGETGLQVSGFAPTVSGTTADTIEARAPVWRRPIVASMALASIAIAGVGAALVHRDGAAAPPASTEPSAAATARATLSPPPPAMPPAPSAPPVAPADVPSATSSPSPTVSATAPPASRPRPATVATRAAVTGGPPSVPAPPAPSRPPTPSGEVDREFH